jgi:membrane-bound serine protease (ClpP class)
MLAVSFRPRRVRAMQRWLGLCMLALGYAAAHAAPAPVALLRLDGAVGPPAADYVARGLARAAADGAQLVVLEIDTPGGLDTSMRQIVKAILASSVPVATYVAPGGARAASAGTFIFYASHIAAMAPGTNLGAASPVSIGFGRDSGGKDDDKEGGKGASKDTHGLKAMNDAAAYIRGLAQLRGRNAEWAERAVRKAVSLPASEALKLKVADYIAVDRADLLRQLDGKRVTVQGSDKILATAGAPTIDYEADWRTRLLAVITNPSIALVLLMVGVYGLFFEFSNPGFVAPGVIGGISLLVALFALQLLPLNYAGLALIGLGIALMIAEMFVPSFGSLGIGGVVAFVIGAVMLVDTDVPGYGIPIALVAAVAAISALFIAAVGGLALKARSRPVVTGREQLVGITGEVLPMSGGDRWVRVHGELWRAAADVELRPGQRVRVVGLDGLTLTVKPLEQEGG